MIVLRAANEIGCHFEIVVYVATFAAYVSFFGYAFLFWDIVDGE